MREIVGNLRLAAPEFDISYDAPDTPLTVSADKLRIEQVVTNLVNNAVKYSGDSRKVEVTIRRQGDEAITSVHDYGLGIPADQLGQVFGRFFRGRNATSAHYPGLGLGLYLSHGIIARHEGRMWVQSTEGEGSTFYFALPALRAAPSPASLRSD
jgi:signal transduction histidine kinase